METAKLIVHARGETQQMPLNPEGTLIGRTKPAEVVLDSRMVSRRHARIFRDPFGRWIVEDLGSSNGTFVQGRRIEQCPVLPAEPVHIGPFVLKIAQPPDWLNAGSPPPAYEANLLVTDFETEFFQDPRCEPLQRQPCPQRWAELTASLSELTHLAALYPEICRHLGRTRNTVALVLRVPPAPEPLPSRPEVCAVYLSDNPYEAAVDDTIGYYPPLPAVLQERAYRLSRRVLEKVRAGREPAMAKTIFTSDTEVTVTLIDEFSPRLIIVAPLVTATPALDLLYVDLPFDDTLGAGPEELFAFVRLAARETARVHKTLSLMELRAGRSILDAELSLARDMQVRLAPAVPAEGATGFDVAVHYAPVMWVGGDYADVWWVAPGYLALAVGHVDSIGLPAALALHSLRLAVRAAADPVGNLADMLARVNRQFLAHPLHQATASLFLGLLDPGPGVLRFVNAAHPQPLGLRPHAAWSALGQPDSGRLGEHGAAFHEHTLQLRDMAGLLLYTRGVTHARSPRGEEFGAAGLARALKVVPAQPASGVVRAVADAVGAFRHSCAPMHDLTLLALTPTSRA